MDCLNTQQMKEMVLYVAQHMIENRDFLSEIDRKIGDGDHGIGISNGFEAVCKNLRQSRPASINDVFRIAGMSLLNSMGGASGVIFGVMFLSAYKQKEVILCTDVETFGREMGNSLDAVKLKGKANLGDKTMVDAFEPAVEAIRGCTGNDFAITLKEAADAAYEGVQNTKKYAASVGRAKFLNQRSVGFQDAGATSVWLIFKYMHEWAEGRMHDHAF